MMINVLLYLKHSHFNPTPIGVNALIDNPIYGSNLQQSNRSVELARCLAIRL
jgi:hypothetical protein